MPSFSYEDKLFGGKKKRISFIKNAQKQIQGNTLYYLKDFGRSNWVKPIEIFDKTLFRTDLFNSNLGKIFFSLQGSKGQISNSTHKLRKGGYPIISGKGGKGYRYADEETEDYINHWDEALSSMEERRTRLDDEYRNHEAIIKSIIKRLLEKKRFEEAKQLRLVLERYRK